MPPTTESTVVLFTTNVICASGYEKELFVLSAAALVLAACTQEIIQDENNAAFVDGPTSFTAVMEGD